MELESVSGLVLIAGTMVIYLGFGIFSSRVYTADDVAVRVDLVNAHPRRWTISQGLVIVGAIITLMGLALLTLWLLPQASAVLSWLAFASSLIGTVSWVRHLQLRVSSPRAFARGQLPFWHFLIYTTLTPISLALFGIVFWQEMIAPELGVALLIAVAVVLVLTYLLKDMPPFVHYAMTLAIGLVLVL